MTEEQKNAIRENLYNKSVRELVEIIISQQEELQEAKEIRSTLMKVRNLVTPKEERRPQGRPRKDSVRSFRFSVAGNAVSLEQHYVFKCHYGCTVR